MFEDMQMLCLTIFLERKIIVNLWKSNNKPVTSADADSETEDLFEKQIKRARFDAKHELERYLSELPIKSSNLKEGILGWWKVCLLLTILIKFKFV